MIENPTMVESLGINVGLVLLMFILLMRPQGLMGLMLEPGGL